MRALVAMCAATLASAGILTACSDALSQTPCANDGGCAPGLVCALGSCLDPDNQQLSTVDIEIDASASAALPVQSVIDIDLDTSPRIDVDLRGGISASGVARSARGAGIPALVLARPDRFIAGRAIAPSASAADDGSFSMVLVDGVAYRTSVLPSDTSLAPGYDDDPFFAGGLNDEMTLTTGLTGQLPDAGDDAVILTGFVKAGDGAAEQGIDHLEVHVENADGRVLSSSSITGLNGLFTVAMPVTPGALALLVSPTVDNQFFPRISVPVDASVAGEVGVPFDLGVISLGVILTPARFEARVTGASGDPVAGATATMEAEIGNGVFRTVVTSDEEGQLDAQLPPGTYSVVVIAPADQTDAGLLVSTQVDVPSTNEDLTFPLKARVRFAGTVKDPDKKPLPGALLTAVRVKDEDGNPEPLLAGTFIAFTTTSDAAGNFELAVDPGTYRVATTPPLGQNAPASSDLVQVRDGGLDRDIRLPERAVVAGTVLAAGAPVASAFVRVFSTLLDERGAAILVGEAVSGPDGAFSIVVPDFVGGGVQNPDPP